MTSLLLLNGSPRGARSNSLKMMSRVAEGWSTAGEGAGEVEVLHLAHRDDFTRAVEEFGKVGTVLLGFPLYTDSMPGLVNSYIEALAPYCGRAENPRLAFLVQSGFSEPLHSRPVERYLEKLAVRLGCPYGGTIVRGGGEALQAMPDQANERLWTRLRALGASLTATGSFDPHLLEQVARAERFSPTKAAAWKVLLKLSPAQFYWNAQLKKNGAWKARFARPYAEPRQ